MDETKSLLKNTCAYIGISLFILFSIYGMTAAENLADAWQFQLDPGVTGLLLLACLILAFAIAEGILRLFGVSFSGGKTIEVYTRSSAGSCGKTLSGDAVEARYSRWITILHLTLTPIVGFFGLVGSQIYEVEAILRWIWVGVGSLFLLAFVITLINYGKPHARVDEKGVTGYPPDGTISRRFAPWTQIFSCEVLTIYDTFGAPVLLTPTFKDRDGKPLMVLSLSLIPMVEQERIVKFIKTKLPETELDSWLL